MLVDLLYATLRWSVGEGTHLKVVLDAHPSGRGEWQLDPFAT